MNTKILDIYTDHLMTCPKYATETGLLDTLNNDISHDKVTEVSCTDDFNSTSLNKTNLYLLDNIANCMYLTGVINKDKSNGILYLVCGNLDIEASEVNNIYQKRWKVEEYHKSLTSNIAGKLTNKNYSNPSNHIFASLYAFFKFELLKTKTNLNHFALRRRYI